MEHNQDTNYESPQVEFVIIEAKSTIMEGTVDGNVPDIPGGGGD